MHLNPIKNYNLLFVLPLLLFFYKADAHSSYDCINAFLKCDSPIIALEKQLLKSDLTLYIDYTDVAQYNMGDLEKLLHINYFLINNSNDTVRYIGAGSLTSKFFRTDNPNVTIIDNVWPQDSLIQLVIPPHRGITGYLVGKFKKHPVATFGFKLGMRLLKWEKGGGNSILNKTTSDGTDMVWSDSQTVEINKKHYSYKAEMAKVKAHWLTRPITAFFPPLTKEDRNKYILSIDGNKILKMKDSIVFDLDIQKRKATKRTGLVTKCPVKLSNNSNDTLTYINMDCSWTDIYKPDNSNFSVITATCFKNVFTTFKVLPHKSVTVWVPVKTFDSKSRNLKIRMGINLYKYNGRNQFDVFNPDELILKPDTYYTIWSNEVIIK